MTLVIRFHLVSESRPRPPFEWVHNNKIPLTWYHLCEYMEERFLGHGRIMHNHHTSASSSNTSSFIMCVQRQGVFMRPTFENCESPLFDHFQDQHMILLLARVNILDRWVAYFTRWPRWLHDLHRRYFDYEAIGEKALASYQPHEVERENEPLETEQEAKDDDAPTTTTINNDSDDEVAMEKIADAAQKERDTAIAAVNASSSSATANNNPSERRIIIYRRSYMRPRMSKKEHDRVYKLMRGIKSVASKTKLGRDCLDIVDHLPHGQMKRNLIDLDHEGKRFVSDDELRQLIVYCDQAAPDKQYVKRMEWSLIQQTIAAGQPNDNAIAND